MQPNLSRKATLKDMRRVMPEVEAIEAEDALEKAGQEPTTPASKLAGRKGYDPDFIEGWRIELPVNHPDALMVGSTGSPELKYTHFSVVMSQSRKMPLLTAVNIDGSQAKSLPRITTWSFDGRLPKSDQLGDAVYDGNALDRGHMVRREDPVWGTAAEAKQANIDTFHFTNSCPQMGAMNQKTWLSLENYVLHNAKADGMRISVFTGPYFSEHDVEYRGAKVPLAFWKVVAFVDDEGYVSATAYKVDQSKELEDLEFVFAGFKTYQISVQSVMDDTGIDFSALVDYDGFSQHELESTTGRLVEQIESLEMVRV